MPQVPIYGAPKVQESAGFNNQIAARADAETFGVGESANRLMDATNKVVLQAKNNADQVAVMEADKQMAELEMRELYDPETGAFNKKGKDAFNSVTQVNEALNKQIESIEGNLSNDQQKNAFRQRYQQRSEQIQRQLYSHVAAETQQYDNAQTEASLQTAQNLVAANPYDTENVQRAIGDQERLIREHAQRNGRPEEWITQKVAEAKSKTGMVAINQMMAKGDDLSAAEFFEQNKQAFAGEDLTRATRIVEEGSLLGASMRNADDIFGKTGSLTQAMAMTKDIENPRIRQATEQRVSQLFQQKKMARQDYEERINISASNFIDEGKSWQQWAQANPTAWDALPTSNKQAIQNYAQHKDAQSDGIRAYDIQTLASQQPQVFMAMDLGKERLKGAIDKSEFVRLGNLQQTMKNGGGQKELAGIRTREDEIKLALEQVYGKNVSLTEKAAFEIPLNKEIMQQQETLGRLMTQEETQKLAQSFAKKVVIEKRAFWFDKTAFNYELDPEQRATIAAREIPKDKREQVIAALRSQNMPVNEQNIVKLYNSVSANSTANTAVRSTPRRTTISGAE